MATILEAPRSNSVPTSNTVFDLPEDAVIMARVARIKRQWSREEREERAEVGRHRRALLAALVESAAADPDAVAECCF